MRKYYYSGQLLPIQVIFLWFLVSARRVTVRLPPNPLLNDLLRAGLVLVLVGLHAVVVCWGQAGAPGGLLDHHADVSSLGRSGLD